MGCSRRGAWDASSRPRTWAATSSGRASCPWCATQVSHLPDGDDREPLPGAFPSITRRLLGGALRDPRGPHVEAPSSVAVPEGEIVNGWPRAEAFDPVASGDPEAPSCSVRASSRSSNAGAEAGRGNQRQGGLVPDDLRQPATLPASAKSDGVVPGLRYAEPGEYIEGDLRAADGDPMDGRVVSRSRAAASDALPFHVAGDQHLASVVQYGVEAHEDDRSRSALLPWRTPSRVGGSRRSMERIGRPARSATWGASRTAGGTGSRARRGEPAQAGTRAEPFHDRMPGMGSWTSTPRPRSCGSRRAPMGPSRSARREALPGLARELPRAGAGPVPRAGRPSLPGIARPLLQLRDAGGP